MLDVSDQPRARGNSRGLTVVVEQWGRGGGV